MRKGTREPKPRVPLQREQVVAAAVELCDREGPDALSMRRLAAKLGIEAMSLYHHVPDKDALLDAVAETVLARLDVRGAANGRWDVRLRALARAFRQVARAHPRSFPLVLTRQLSSAVGLRPVEAALAALRDAGLDRTAAVHALRAFVAYLTGAILRELGASPALSGVFRAGVAARKNELLGGPFPTVVDSASQLAECRHEVEYEFGVELLLASLRPLTSSRPRQSKS